MKKESYKGYEITTVNKLDGTIESWAFLNGEPKHATISNPTLGGKSSIEKVKIKIDLHIQFPNEDRMFYFNEYNKMRL